MAWYPYWKLFDVWNPAKIMYVKPIFEERSFSVNNRLVGVLMPFGKKSSNAALIDFDALYEDHIKPSLENQHFEVQRADNEFEQWYSPQIVSSAECERITASSMPSVPGFRSSASPTGAPVKSIMEEIWILLNQSHFLIADVTGKNPNVFYELGIAHTIGKYAIIISQSKEDVPFDVGHLIYIYYVCNKAGIEKLLEEVDKRIEKILRSERFSF
jgi:hypothetical protein